MGKALMKRLCVAALVVAAQSAYAQTPQRIASFNLCADQLVVALADPSQIVGLSPYAQRPKNLGGGRQGARNSRSCRCRRKRWCRTSPISCWSAPGTGR